MFKRKIKLPTSIKEYDDLVTLVVKKFNLSDAHHAAAVLSVAIRHLPPTQAYTTLDYLGHYVLKNIANYVADHRSQTLKHESQVDALVGILTNDPLDNQARDQLEKAANEGSKYAADAISKLSPANEGLSALPN